MELLIGVDEGLQLLLIGCHLLESRRCGEYGLCCSLPVKRLDSDRRRAEGSCLDERHKLLGINCLAGVFTSTFVFLQQSTSVNGPFASQKLGYRLSRN